jgi:AGCS family alanine or glycine:cation symporter
VPIINSIEQGFAALVTWLEQTLFIDIYGLPLVIIWLVAGAIFFTLRMGFINVRGFSHGVQVILGKYDTPDEPGEVTHSQALFTALSATVGLGNIAGVAIAIHLGGPGAVIWMTFAGLIGMSTKFVECTLGQKYRVIDATGHVSGGPMYYLSIGLADLGRPFTGQVLAATFSGCCLLGALGGSNMFQANQSYHAVASLVPALANYRPWYGLVLAALVGLVILGGIRRIGAVAGVIVPFMASLYLAAGLWILVNHLGDLWPAFQTILHDAIHPQAIEGGAIGVMVQGIRRGVFSNEAGIGTAAIAHSATRTSEPVREGLVAMLEPFIDTVLICNMTALVCIVTGVYQTPGLTGVTLTLEAFSSEITWFPIILTLAICLFAFSTIISWYYYGVQAWEYVLGTSFTPIYQFFYILCVFLGVISSLGAVLTFSDMMMFAMAFPAVLGGMMLSNTVAEETKLYWRRLHQSPAGATITSTSSENNQWVPPTQSQTKNPGQS